MLRSRAFNIAALPADHHLLPMLVSLSDLAITFRDGGRLSATYPRLNAHAGMQVRRDFADWGPVLYHLARAARGLGLRDESRRLIILTLAQGRRSTARSWALWASHASR